MRIVSFTQTSQQLEFQRHLFINATVWKTNPVKPLVIKWPRTFKDVMLVNRYLLKDSSLDVPAMG